MSKIVNQVVFIDTSTASYKTIKIWDCIEDIGKFPIPRIGEFVNLYTKNDDGNGKCIDYQVTNITYAYKQFNKLLSSESTVVYITIFIKRV